MEFLKQSTATTVRIGPFVDKTDFVTPETGLGGNGGNIETNVRLSKAGAAFTTRNSTTAPAHDLAGWYSLHLDATDTNSAGSLIIECSDASTYAPVRKEFTVLPARAFARQVDGATFNANGGRVWYVAASGGSSSNPGTLSAPLNSFTSAQSAASGGDTIILLNGTYAPFTISRAGLTVMGQSRTGVIVETTTAISIIISTNDVTLRQLSTAVTSTSDGVGVSIAEGLSNTLIDSCNVQGSRDGVHARATFGTRIISSSIHAFWDAVMVYNSKGFLIENCSVTSDGTFNSPSGTIGGVHAAEGAVGIVRNTDIVLTSSNTTPGRKVVGVSAGQAASEETATKPAVLLENVHIKVAQTNSSATGGAYGIVGDLTTPTQHKCLVLMIGGSIEVSHANGSAEAKEIDASVSGSKVFVYGVDFTLANCLGLSNIYPLDLNVLDAKTRALLALPAAAPGASGGLTLVP